MAVLTKVLVYRTRANIKIIKFNLKKRFKTRPATSNSSAMIERDSSETEIAGERETLRNQYRCVGPFESIRESGTGGDQHY